MPSAEGLFHPRDIKRISLCSPRPHYGPQGLCPGASVSPLELKSGHSGGLASQKCRASKAGGRPAPRDVTDLQKPELSNNTQSLLSCGRQTCSPRPGRPGRPACHQANPQAGPGFPRAGRGGVLCPSCPPRAAPLPAPSNHRPRLPRQAGWHWARGGGGWKEEPR